MKLCLGIAWRQVARKQGLVSRSAMRVPASRLTKFDARIQPQLIGYAEQRREIATIF